VHRDNRPRETSNVIRPPGSIASRALALTAAVAGLTLATSSLSAASPAALSLSKLTTLPVSANLARGLDLAAAKAAGALSGASTRENLFLVFQILSIWNCRNANSGDN